MERRPLGTSRLLVPTVGFGTYRVFNVTGDAALARAEAVIDAALEEGANLFDSSPMYGAAEECLANGLGDRREETIVATKVWAKRRYEGEEQIDHALELFEHIDLYQVHNMLGADDHLPYLQHLKQGGRVSAIGLTHYLESAEAELLERMEAGGIDAIQIPYHPLERWVERKLLAEAARLQVGVVVMTPLSQGRLLDLRPSSAELAPLSRFGVFTWAQVLLKWILSDSRVSCVIPATSSVDHARENCVAGSPPWFGTSERQYVSGLLEKLAA